MIKKFYELNKGDIAVMGGREYTFIKMDGMYALWADDNGDTAIGQFEEYEQKEDGKLYPIINY